MTNKNKESLDFYGLGIAPKLLEILEELKYTIPTPIQLNSIPVTIEGKDIVGIAQTGTGKTLAFGVPMLQRLAQYKGRGLVLAPTRELASQIDEHLKVIGEKMGLRTAVIIGGEPTSKHMFAFRRNPHVIIATPGRLTYYLKNNYFNLKDVKILVLDEADMMFDMGFAPQIEEILKYVPTERQTMLFSATMPPAIMKMVLKHMAMPVRIEVAPSGTPAENVIQEMIMVSQVEKFSQLVETLKEYSGSVLVFLRTKHGTKKICARLNEIGERAAEIHSNRSLAQRKEALSGFKNGRYRILTATDIAARGIDVTGIELVINYDLPDNSEDYVHRIGRTGRAGKSGRAISLVLPHQKREVQEIERLIKKTISLKHRSGGVTFKREDFPKREGGQERNFHSKKPIKRGFVASDKKFGNYDNKFERKFERTERKNYRDKNDRRPRNNEIKNEEKYSHDLVDVFNPFKDEPKKFEDRPRRDGGFSKPRKTRPYEDKKPFERRKKPFNKFKRGNDKTFIVDERRMTDKERFKRSLRSNF